MDFEDEKTAKSFVPVLLKRYKFLKAYKCSLRRYMTGPCESGVEIRFSRPCSSNGVRFNMIFTYQHRLSDWNWIFSLEPIDSPLYAAWLGVSPTGFSMMPLDAVDDALDKMPYAIRKASFSVVLAVGVRQLMEELVSV